MDDLVGEILIRVPPDEPAHLVLAALVCKPWRRILADRGFLRRYREFHRTPPLLGFLHNVLMSGSMPRFVPTTTTASPCSPPALDSGSWWALDSRHGRVLIHSLEPMELIVWDPITGDQQHLPLPEYPHAYCTGAVLCATAGCDHLHCRGGPFMVVFVGTDDEEGITWASEYSSETGAWSASTTVDLSESTTVDFDSYVETRPSLLIGDVLYFTFELGKGILLYDLGGQTLLAVDAPELYQQGGIAMTAEDGGLGFASVEGNSIHLYSWQDGDEDVAGWAGGEEDIAGADGEDSAGCADGDESTGGWVLCRVIELKTLLPICNLSVSPNVIGFVEGTDTIFMYIDVGVFTLELKSGKVRKVGEKGPYNAVVPYMSFYAPAANLQRRHDQCLSVFTRCRFRMSGLPLCTKVEGSSEKSTLEGVSELLIGTLAELEKKPEDLEQATLSPSSAIYEVTRTIASRAAGDQKVADVMPRGAPIFYLFADGCIEQRF